MLFAIVSLFAAVFLSASLIRQANTKLSNDQEEQKSKKTTQEYQPKKPSVSPSDQKILEEAFSQKIKEPSLQKEKIPSTANIKIAPDTQKADEVEKYRSTPSIEELSVNIENLKQQKLAQRVAYFKENPSNQDELSTQEQELKPLVQSIKSLGHYDFGPDDQFDEHIRLIQVAPRKPTTLKKKKKKKKQIEEPQIDLIPEELDMLADNSETPMIDDMMGEDPLGEDEITPTKQLMQDMAQEVSSLVNLSQVNQRANPQIQEQSVGESNDHQKGLLPFNLSEGGLLASEQLGLNINYDLSSLDMIDTTQNELNEWWISVNVSNPKLYQQIQNPIPTEEQPQGKILKFNDLNIDETEHLDRSEDGESKVLSWQEYQQNKINK